MADNPGLHPRLNAQIKQADKDGGLLLADIKIGETIHIKTNNTTYTIKKESEDVYWLNGNKTFCPQPVKVEITGSTFGGSVIKTGWIGIGMCLEMHLSGMRGRFTTTPILVIEAESFKQKNN